MVPTIQSPTQVSMPLGDAFTPRDLLPAIAAVSAASDRIRSSTHRKLANPAGSAAAALDGDSGAQPGGETGGTEFPLSAIAREIVRLSESIERLIAIQHPVSNPSIQRR